MTSTTITRYHDLSCGHRVHGHDGKCANLHGHNYRVYFTVGADHLDKIGRIIDFDVVRSRLCDWLEKYWDHRFLIWENDPAIDVLVTLDATVVSLPFNPTAENLAHHLLKKVGPDMLFGTGTELIRVVVEETRKCSATVEVASRG